MSEWQITWSDTVDIGGCCVLSGSWVSTNNKTQNLLSPWATSTDCQTLSWTRSRPRIVFFFARLLLLLQVVVVFVSIFFFLLAFSLLLFRTNAHTHTHRAKKRNDEVISLFAWICCFLRFLPAFFLSLPLPRWGAFPDRTQGLLRFSRSREKRRKIRNKLFHKESVR